MYIELMGFPGGSVVNSPPANAGGTGSIPGSGRSIPWRKKWPPTPVFLPRDRGTWRAMIHRVSKSQT